MSTPDKCPHCGAELRSYIDPTWKLYACGTSDTLPQTAHCRERAARIKAETAHAATKRELEEVQKENGILRGLLPHLNAPCVHCGLTIIGKCERGFPGCAAADDLMCADQTLHGDVLARLRKAEACVAELEKWKLAAKALWRGVMAENDSDLLPAAMLQVGELIEQDKQTLGQAMPAQTKYELEVAKACGKSAPHIAALYIHSNTPNT